MLNIHICFKRGILFIKLDGNLNSDTVLKMNDEVTTIIKENKIRNIVFNVSNLKEIDKKGINSLMKNYYISSKNEGHSLLCGINNNIKKVINDSNLLKYMDETANELEEIKKIYE